MQELVTSFFRVSTTSAWLNTPTLPPSIPSEFLHSALGVLERSCPPPPLGRALHPPTSPSSQIYIPVKLHEHLLFGVALGPVVSPAPSASSSAPTPVVTRFVLDSGRRAALLFSYLSDNTIAVSIDLFDELGDRLAETTYFAPRTETHEFPNQVLSRLKLLHKRDCASCASRAIPCICPTRLEEALSRAKRRRRNPQLGGERIDGPGFAIRRHPFWQQQLEQFVDSRLGSYVAQVSSMSATGEAAFTVAFRAEFSCMSREAATDLVRTTLYDRGVLPTVVPVSDVSLDDASTVSVDKQNVITPLSVIQPPASDGLQKRLAQPAGNCMVTPEKVVAGKSAPPSILAAGALHTDATRAQSNCTAGRTKFFVKTVSVDALNRTPLLAKAKISSSEDVLSTSSPVSEIANAPSSPLPLMPERDEGVAQNSCQERGRLKKRKRVRCFSNERRRNHVPNCSPTAQFPQCRPSRKCLPGKSCAPGENCSPVKPSRRPTACVLKQCNPTSRVCLPEPSAHLGPMCTGVWKPGVFGNDKSGVCFLFDPGNSPLQCSPGVHKHSPSSAAENCPSSERDPAVAICPPGQSCLSVASCLRGRSLQSDHKCLGRGCSPIENCPQSECFSSQVQLPASRAVTPVRCQSPKLQLPISGEVDGTPFSTGACAAANGGTGECCPAVPVAEPEDPNAEWKLPSHAPFRPEVGSVVLRVIPTRKRLRMDTKNSMGVDGEDQYDGDDEETDDRPPSPCMCDPIPGQEDIVDSITGFVRHEEEQEAIVESNVYAVQRWEREKRLRKRRRGRMPPFRL